jgi:hypothetical protein
MAKIRVPRPRVTREQLAQRLTDLGVPPGACSLYGTGRQAEGFCMDQLPLGRWVVYWAERGSRGSERFFDDEGDACEEMFRLLKDDGIVPADANLL